ncbi:MAG: efflux RND transporter permease subunit [Candidatus Aminicenantes bacterium]|nr:efflux RND transporter permease subunit [Candidatus Aminicenantes bacterium]
MKLPEFSVHRRVSTTMIVMILVVVGLIAFSRLGLDFFPDIEYPTVTVITNYQGASSEDIEKSITRLLEQVVSSVNKVRKVTSQSMEGVSMIMTEFVWGANLDFAAQDIRDQIKLYRNFLPKDAEDPMVVKFNFAQMPIIMYGVTGPMPSAALKKMLEDDVAPRLERIDGVASARVFGSDTREIQVEIDKNALDARKVSLDKVLMALAMENINLPAGYLNERHSEYLIRTLGEYGTLDDIRNTVVGATPAGEVIYVKDIAAVKDGLKDVRSIGRIQGKKGAFLMISKRSGANTAITGEAVKKVLGELRINLPAGVEFSEAFDQSAMIQRVTKYSVDDALFGGILAIALILLFLRNWRPTLIIALAIPLSIVTTFIAFYLAGYTLNLLTLGGLALGVGRMVDDSIVVIENTFRHIELGESRKEAAIRGASEVGMAVTASTLTTIVVFFPMVVASGITAKLTRGLAVAIVFSLVSSLFVSLTIVPMLSSLLLRAKGEGLASGRARPESQFEKARRAYRRLLEKALRRRGWILGGAFLLFAMSFVLVPFLGTEFMPAFDVDMIFLKVKMPVGTALDETNRVLTVVEKIVAGHPEVRTVTAQGGQESEEGRSMSTQSGFSTSGSHEGMLWIGLVHKTDRKSTDLQVLERIRRSLPKLENVKFEAVDVSGFILGGQQIPVSIKIYGKDLAVLKDLGDRTVGQIRDIAGLRDLTHTLAKGKPEYRIRIDREKAAQAGLSVYQVANMVQTATQGKVVSRYREGGEEFDLRVLFREEFRNDMDMIRNIPILNPLNKTVYLSQVAAVEPGEGPIEISRENQTRIVTVTANIAGRDLGSVVKDIKARLVPMEKELPAGYFFEYGGAYEQMKDAFLVLAGVFALAVLLIYMVMASQFESFLHPLVIMFTIPMALIGVILLLIITSQQVNLMVGVGFILLAGIAVANGIVMIDYMNQLKRRGLERKEAIIQGAVTRLRPVVLTALATILGMIPMAVSRSMGSEMRSPMAITVIGGLTATTLLTLFVLPIIYSLFERVSFKNKPAEE